MVLLPYPCFCLRPAVVEVHDPTSGHDAPFIGVCALDTAAGHILLGSWRDDEVGDHLFRDMHGVLQDGQYDIRCLLSRDSRCLADACSNRSLPVTLLMYCI